MKVYKDLGVVVDTSLKFHLHINSVVCKAAGLAHQILRGTVCRSPAFMVTLFISHIRPMMDYCCTVWNSGYMGDVRKLESVQRRWTREIDGMNGLEYADRLRNLGLYSIYGRYLRADLIKVWKIFHAPNDIGLSHMFERSPNLNTRGHRFKLVLPLCRTEIKRRFLNVRCVKAWNSLPGDAVESCSVESFKRYLDVLLEDRFFGTIDGR